MRSSYSQKPSCIIQKNFATAFHSLPPDLFFSGGNRRELSFRDRAAAAESGVRIGHKLAAANFVEQKI